MLPEAEQRRFDVDLQAEQRICSARSLDDPALLADRRLRQELSALAPSPVPPAMRQRLMRRLPARPVWPVAIAASVLAAVVLGLSLRSAPPAAPTSADMQALGYALGVIGDRSQDGLRRALRTSVDSLDQPLLQTEALPYLDLIRPALPRPAGSLPPHQEYAR
jgi:hypothetical protein